MHFSPACARALTQAARSKKSQQQKRACSTIEEVGHADTYRGVRSPARAQTVLARPPQHPPPSNSRNNSMQGPTQTKGLSLVLEFNPPYLRSQRTGDLSNETRRAGNKKGRPLSCGKKEGASPSFSRRRKEGASPLFFRRAGDKTGRPPSFPPIPIPPN